MLYTIVLITVFILFFLPTYLVLSKETFGDFYFKDIEGRKILLNLAEKDYVKITDDYIYKNYDNTFNLIKKYFRIVFSVVLLFSVYLILFYFEVKIYILENQDLIIFISKFIFFLLIIVIFFLINSVKVNFYYVDRENKKILYRKILFGNFKKVNGKITYKYFNKKYKIIVNIRFREGIPKYIELKINKILVIKITLLEIVDDNFNSEFIMIANENLTFMKGKGLFKFPSWLYGNYSDNKKIYFQIKKSVSKISCRLIEDTYFFRDIYYNTSLFSDSSSIVNLFKDFIVKGILEKYYKNGKLGEKMVIENRNNYVKYENFYENGNLLFKGNRKIKEFEFNGIFEYHYENGKLKERGNYNSGKLLGPFESFYENGKLKEKMNLDVKGNGIFEYFYENGRLMEKGSYENYKKNGLFEKFYQSGRLEEKGSYKDGYVRGNIERFYENGNIKEREGYNWYGRKDGLFEYFSEDGKLIKKENYKDGELI